MEVSGTLVVPVCLSTSPISGYRAGRAARMPGMQSSGTVILRSWPSKSSLAASLALSYSFPLVAFQARISLLLAFGFHELSQLKVKQ